MTNANTAHSNSTQTAEELEVTEWLNDLLLGDFRHMPLDESPRLKTPFSATPTSSVLAFPTGGRRSS